jgi:hypothetical protein
MNKKDSVKNLLSASIRKEETKITQRFENADSLIIPTTATPPPPLPTATKQHAVRVTYTFSAEDIELLDRLVTRACLLGRVTNKSEMMRAGMHALSTHNDASFLALMDGIEKLKKGRPV